MFCVGNLFIIYTLMVNIDVLDESKAGHHRKNNS